MRDQKHMATSQKELHHQRTTSERQEAAMVEEAQMEVDAVADPIENLKLRCLAKGVTGVLDFGRVVRRLDFADDHTLNFEEYCAAIDKAGLEITDNKVAELFSALDLKKSGRIEVHDLIVAARPHLSATRLKVIHEAFNNLDRRGKGLVTADDIRHGFCVEFHPRFHVGEESKEHILEKFLDNFQTTDRSWDGVLTEEEFINYYSGISPTIEEDGFFDLMMRQSFKLEHGTERLYHETKSERRESDLMNASLTEVDGRTDALAKLRAHCISKGISSILQLGRLLHSMLPDPTHKLCNEELTEYLNKAGTDLSSEDCHEIFHAVKDSDGLVSVSAFLAALRPALSEDRRHIIADAFKKLDRSGDGVVTAEDFKRGFCVNRHPRYVVGDETREQIIDKMLSKFDSPGWDRKVTMEDFLNYYAVESATINDDTFFDLMMRQSFKL